MTLTSKDYLDIYAQLVTAARALRPAVEREGTGASAGVGLGDKALDRLYLAAEPVNLAAPDEIVNGPVAALIEGAKYLHNVGLESPGSAGAREAGDDVDRAVAELRDRLRAEIAENHT